MICRYRCQARRWSDHLVHATTSSDAGTELIQASEAQNGGSGSYDAGLALEAVEMV